MRRMFCLCMAPLLITSCNASDAAVTGRMTVEKARADVAAVATPNPHPRRAYRITLRINNAPGEFKYVKGGAQYDVVNEDECGRIHPMTGLPARMTSLESVQLSRISETEYQGIVYADYMQDDDYYGRGVCRWELTGASATLKATGAHEETRFFADIDAAEVVSGQPHTLYHARHVYPRARPTLEHPNIPWVENHASIGHRDPSAILPTVRATAFSVTMSAEALVQ
mgnify:CR=1 FL=1